MRWTTNTTKVRERSRRGLGPRDKEEQRTQRASFVTTSRTRVHTAAAAVSHRRLGRLFFFLIDVNRRGMSLRGQTRVGQRRLGCLSPGPSKVHSARLFAAPNSSS